MHCTLYTFARHFYEGQTPCGVAMTKVARLTDEPPDDWHSWADHYRKYHPSLLLLEIASIDFVDDRSMIEG